MSNWKRVEAGQRPRIRQRKSARGGNFDYHQVPPVGTFYVFDSGTSDFFIVVIAFNVSFRVRVTELLMLVNDSPFNPVNPSIHIQILQTNLHTFP